MKIHFLGICGTAMASVAALLRQQGHDVSGSDEGVYPPMSDFLRDRGISIASPFAEKNLAHQPDRVVVGNAMKRGNPELEAAMDRKWPLVSMPEVVKDFLIRGKTSIVITGTHGKTTTTALTAWIFEHAGLDPGFLVGGIPLNFGHGAKLGKKLRGVGASERENAGYFIIEGDEYDTAFFDKRSKFVHYLPEIVVINNLEFDHADIFDSIEAIQRSFWQLIRIIPRNGLLLANGDDPNVRALLADAPCPVKTFGLGEKNDFRAENIECRSQESEFRIQNAKIKIPMVGEFNVRNALAAVTVARHCGISHDKIQEALATFQGIKRRMEVRGEAGGVTVVDDFAHHPTALRETLTALRIRFPQRRIWALFEPRSNTTRRNFFQRELAEALALADGVFLGKIDRLHELAEGERLNPEKMMADIRAAGRVGHYGGNVEELVQSLLPNLRPGDVVAVFSNGGFGGIHQKLLTALAK